MVSNVLHCIPLFLWTTQPGNWTSAADDADADDDNHHHDKFADDYDQVPVSEILMIMITIQ